MPRLHHRATMALKKQTCGAVELGIHGADPPITKWGMGTRASVHALSEGSGCRHTRALLLTEFPGGVAQPCGIVVLYPPHGESPGAPTSVFATCRRQGTGGAQRSDNVTTVRLGSWGGIVSSGSLGG